MHFRTAQDDIHTSCIKTQVRCRRVIFTLSPLSYVILPPLRLAILCKLRHDDSTTIDGLLCGFRHKWKGRVVGIVALPQCISCSKLCLRGLHQSLDGRSSFWCWVTQLFHQLQWYSPLHCLASHWALHEAKLWRNICTQQSDALGQSWNQRSCYRILVCFWLFQLCFSSGLGIQRGCNHEGQFLLTCTVAGLGWG